MADNVIDTLSIEVDATASKASSTLTELQSNLKALNRVLNAIDVSKLSNAQQKIQSVKSAISSVQNASNVSASPKIDTSNISKSQNDIEKRINSIKQSLAGLNSYASAAMNGDGSSYTSFNRKVIHLQSDIDKAKEALSQLGNTSIPTTAFSALDAQIESTRTKLDELKAKESSLGGKAVDLGEYIALKDEIQLTEGELDNLISKQEELINSGQAFTDPFADYRDSLDGVQAELITTSDDVRTAVDNINSSSIDSSGIKTGLSDIASTAKEAASNLWSLVKSGIQSGFKGIKTTLSGIKSALSGIGKNASNAASTGLSKILKYGFGIRSLYVLFRRLRTAVKDSFTELQNSGAYYETTKSNIDALKSSLSTLKYQFGAAFEPIFNTVAPALQTLVNYLVSVMNTLSAFIAKLTGKSTYSKAVASTAAIASNTGSAAGSAAELNKQLQGFDERNNLDLDSGSSGGSGGGGSSDGGSVEYVEESVESALGDFTNSLIDMIKNGDWGGVGSAISTKITNALNEINWDEIKNKASTFGSNVASFFNGFITTDLFSAIGTTLAESVNTAFTGLNSFGTTFDWTNFGTSIGTGISTFFKKADFSLYGDTVHTWVGGILDAGISLLENTDFKLIGTKLGDFFNSLQVSDLLDKVKTLCSNIITAIGDTITGFKTNTDEKTKLATAIGALLGTLAITKDVKLTLVFTATLAGIYLGEKYYEWVSGNEVNQSFISELQDIWQGLFEDQLISFNIASAIKFVWDDITGKNNVDQSGIKAGITTAIGALFGPTSFITGALVTVDVAQLISWDFTNFVSEFKKNWNLMWNGGSYSDFGKGANGMPSDVAEKVTYSSGFKKELENYGQFIVDGLKEGIELSLKTNPFTRPVEKIYELIKEAITTKFEIDSPAKAMYEFGKYIFLGIIEGFIEAMNNYGWDDFAEDLYNHFSPIPVYTTKKTGGTAQGNFSNSHDTIHKNLKLKTTLSGATKSKKDVDDLTTSFTSLTTEASKNTEAEYKTSVGGQISNISELTEWKNTFENLYKKWLGRDAKFTTSEDGFESKISGWLEKLDVLGKEWQKKAKDAKFTTTESGLSNFEGTNGYKAKLDNIENQWKNDGKNRTATFTTNLAGNLNSSSALSTAASAMSTLNSSFQGDKSASFSVSYSGPSGTDLGSYAGGVASINSAFSEANSKTLAYTISASVDMDSVNAAVSKISNEISKGITTRFKLTKEAKGGIISGKNVFNIPQYAGGTLDALNHGTVFAAGERGPEIMGHINGRTEILNRSQIASIMHSSFVSAMADFRQMELTTPQELMSDYSSYMSTTANGEINTSNNNTAMLAEQNRLLREQNELISQLLEKPSGISSRDIFDANRSEANNFYNRTGKSPFVF